MKKILIIMSVVVLILLSQRETTYVVPKNHMRFRVIANSNSLKDLDNKNKLSVYLGSFIQDLTKNATSTKDSKRILLNNLDLINKKIDEFKVKNKIFYQHQVLIGNNYFPTKNYRGVKYQSGRYESLVVKLGKSSGTNWWCVIYPPLCLIDDKDKSDVEYKSLIKELITS